LDWSGSATAHEASDGPVEEMQLGGKPTPFITDVSPETLQQEKEKARALKKTRWWQRQMDRGVCFYCQESVTRDQATLDHIVPLIRGGRSIRSNIVLACKTCNSQKKYLLPMEWEEYLRQARSPTGEDSALPDPMDAHGETCDE
jgi:5-methylcytosine-specific restriction protein A